MSAFGLTRTRAPPYLRFTVMIVVTQAKEASLLSVCFCLSTPAAQPFGLPRALTRSSMRIECQ